MRYRKLTPIPLPEMSQTKSWAALMRNITKVWHVMHGECFSNVKRSLASKDDSHRQHVNMYHTPGKEPSTDFSSSQVAQHPSKKKVTREQEMFLEPMLPESGQALRHPAPQQMPNLQRSPELWELRTSQRSNTSWIPLEGCCVECSISAKQQPLPPNFRNRQC